MLTGTKTVVVPDGFMFSFYPGIHFETSLGNTFEVLTLVPSGAAEIKSCGSGRIYSESHMWLVERTVAVQTIDSTIMRKQSSADRLAAITSVHVDFGPSGPPEPQELPDWGTCVIPPMSTWKSGPDLEALKIRAEIDADAWDVFRAIKQHKLQGQVCKCPLDWTGIIHNQSCSHFSQQSEREIEYNKLNNTWGIVQPKSAYSSADLNKWHKTEGDRSE